jgi:CheY-like chemotaxis protein
MVRKARVARRILLIEDERDTREAVESLLRLYGFEVETAKNGREALAALSDGPLPCVIVLDLMMPDMDGREFREHQLNDPRWAAIPVVVHSGHCDVPAVAAQLGVTAFLVKPISVDALLGVIDRVCEESAPDMRNAAAALAGPAPQ